MTETASKSIPDNLLALQPMLHKNTILIPNEFGDGKVFRELSWAISWVKRNFFEDEERRIVLRFNGVGGSVSDMFACVDLLRLEAEDGTEIAGYLYGESASAHSVLWAACPFRYVLMHSMLSIHSAALWSTKYLGHSDLRAYEREIRESNRRMAQIYADACADPKWDQDYWFLKLEDHPSTTFNLYPDDIVDTYGMAERYEV